MAVYPPTDYVFKKNLNNKYGTNIIIYRVKHQDGKNFEKHKPDP